MPLYIKSIDPQLDIQGPVQEFNFHQNSTSIQNINSFIPTANIPSVSAFEFRNHQASGYRFVQETSFGAMSGVLRLEQFFSAQPSGIPILTLDGTGATFSGVVSAASPISMTHLTNKGYVDNTVNSSLSFLRVDQLSPPIASLNLNTQKITNLATPTASADAATKGYVDSHPVSTFGVPINHCDWNFYRIYNLGDPILSAHAATKGYVDNKTLNSFAAPISAVNLNFQNINTINTTGAKQLDLYNGGTWTTTDNSVGINGSPQILFYKYSGSNATYGMHTYVRDLNIYAGTTDASNATSSFHAANIAFFDQGVSTNQVALTVRGQGETVVNPNNFWSTSRTLLTVNGNAAKVGGGSWATASDQRIKNVRGAYRTGLEAICQLNPVLYSYNEQSGYAPEEESIIRIGLIAQDVEAVLPECVSQTQGAGFSDLRTLDTSPILFGLINAIKEIHQNLLDIKKSL